MAIINRDSPSSIIGLADCPQCKGRLDAPQVIPAGPMPEDAEHACNDAYGVHAAWRRVVIMEAALRTIAAPPSEDDSDALNILQDHWYVAAAGLAGSDLKAGKNEKQTQA